MKIKPSDFPAEYVTRDLAARVAQEVFDKWAKATNTCLHPRESIRAEKLGWLMKNCVWKCELCSREVLINDVIAEVPVPLPKCEELRKYEIDPDPKQ